ncbi:MAG: SH3 domain-containing protein [Desulfobulbaceae bacterium]|nr:SH3 domain-containing protein [Desulfobulbaceae bacterium]HIJ78430.1 SH3 domain-containing protein [Deltaproteobacteria bacterium]
MIRRLCLGFVFIFIAATVAQAEMVSVTLPKVNMRSGPGEKYPILWELGKGFPLKVEERKGNWLKVSDFENDVGWIYKKLVAKKAHLIVKKERINIRSGPGSNYKIVGKAKYGVVLRTIKNGKGWVQIKHENGLTGWVKRSLLWGW